MSFDFSTLITDRTNDDVSALSTLLSKRVETWTQEELEKFNGGMLKGGYWWTDLNRVTACMEYLDEELRGLGYESGYVPVVVHNTIEPWEGVLPDGYTQLEYIESTGTQYIDTGVLPNQDTCFELSAKISIGNSGHAHIMSSNVPKYFALRPSPDYTAFAVRYGNDTALKIIQTENIYAYHKFKRIKNDFYLDDNLVSSSEYVEFQNTKTLPIGCLNSTEGQTQFCNGHYERLKIWQYGQSDSHDFISCVNPSGKVGMYDIIGGSFYESAGSNPFNAGPEIPVKPQPKPVDSYTWYKEDSQKIEQMDAYLENVRRMRGVFSKTPGIPTTPETMRRLTTVEANNIEKILETVETVIQRIKHTVSLGWALGVADIGLYGGI